MPRSTLRAICSGACALLVLPAFAAAQPTVSVSDGRAVFSDSANDPNTDRLRVSAARVPGGMSYTFDLETGAILGLPPTCVRGADDSVAICIVSGGTGVDVRLGEAATAGAAQSVELVDSLDWKDQVNTLTAGPGADTLTGARSTDTLEGRAGADALRGAGAVDDGLDTASYASSTAGVTATLGGAGPDGDVIAPDIENLIGGSGADLLTGDGRPNRIDGGPGDDTLRGGLGSDTLVGGGGSDTLDYSADSGRRGPVSVDLADGTMTSQDSDSDVLSSRDSENVIGTPYDDELAGDGGPNVLTGGGGADTLRGLEGDDLLRMLDGAGTDLGDCGAGTDTAEADAGDAAAGCETINDKPIEPPPPPPEPEPEPSPLPCDDQQSCTDAVAAVVFGLVETVFGCNSVESCQEHFPGDELPCGDPATCRDFVVATLAPILERLPGDGDLPCSSAEACAALVTGMLFGAFGCDSLPDCQEEYGPGGGGGGGGGGSPAPCGDGASCMAWLQAQFRERFGCDSPDTCREKLPAPAAEEEEEEPAQPKAPPPAPAVDRGYPSGDTARTEASSTDSGARTRQRGRLSARMRARRDRSRPFAFVVRGSLVRPSSLSAGDACRGSVQAFLYRGRKIVGRSTARLGADCRYVVTVRSASRARLRLVVRFPGNDAVEPTSVRRRVRAG